MRDAGALTWFGLLVLTEIIVVLVLAPNPWLRSVAEREYDMARAVLSAASVRDVDDRAAHWYRVLIRDTGLESQMYAFAGRAPDGRRLDGDAPPVDSRGLLDYFEGRVEAAIAVLYRVLWRVSSALVWAPFLLLLAIPSVVEGITAWRIRRHGFRYASPLAHRYAWRAQGGIAILCLFALLLPLPLPPQAAPLALAALAAALAISLANMPKRI